MIRFKTLMGAALLLAMGALACCSVPQTILYKPGDTVRVRHTMFNITGTGIKKTTGIYYDVLDMTHGRYVGELSQRNMKPLKRKAR